VLKTSGGRAAALRDKRPLGKWSNNLALMEKWPSFTTAFLEDLERTDPEHYFFMIMTLQAIHEKEQRELDKIKK
jgi:hypothetical protein